MPRKNKYDRLCRKLRLQPSDRLLEIGSGWGAFALYAARNYGCRITTTTISEEQYTYAKELFQREHLDKRIEIKLADYRTLNGSYDKIVSIEMLEAVGHEYLETYFAKCHELLKKNGILAFQVITCADSRYESLRKSIDWIQKHIFPGSLLPSIGVLNKAINRTGDLVMQHMEEFGLSYARTLAQWRENFNSRVGQVRLLGFDERFIGTWNYYLSYCESAFAMRNISVVQMVYTRPNNLSLVRLITYNLEHHHTMKYFVSSLETAVSLPALSPSSGARPVERAVLADGEPRPLHVGGMQRRPRVPVEVSVAGVGA